MNLFSRSTLPKGDRAIGVVQQAQSGGCEGVPMWQELERMWGGIVVVCI